MPKYYYDVLTIEEREITASTVLYLIKVDGLFLIKGISSEIDKLSRDPTTRAEKYWPINTAQLLIRSINDEDVTSIIFPGDRLTDQVIPADKIKTCLGFDPDVTEEKAFNSAVTRQIVNEVNQRFVQDIVNSPPLINHTLFFGGSSGLLSTVTPIISTGLNVWQREALTQLQRYGLTSDMLLSRHEDGHVFDEAHCYALVKLVGRRGYTINAALQAIDGLSSTQAEGIKEGLAREDVIRLTNFWHITALGKLKSNGLTADMLLNHRENGHGFYAEHCYALVRLVQRRGYTINAALQAIDGLSRTQAEGIRDGLEREDVIRLTNFWHITALGKLKSNGLTVDMLLNHRENGYGFDSEHCYALVHLVQRRGYTVEAALQAIDGLSCDQANDLRRNLPLLPRRHF